MNIRIIVALLYLVLTGCWDASLTPVFENTSGQDVVLKVVYDNEERASVIKNSESFVFPNLMEEPGFKRLELLSDKKIIGTYSRRQLADYLEKYSREKIVIQPGLVVTLQPDNK